MATPCDGGGGGKDEAVMVLNGRAARPWMRKDELLKEHVGAYTTARTVDQTSVFEFSMHCQRLHETATAILKRELPSGSSDATATGEQTLAFLDNAGADGLRPLVRGEIRAALEHLGVAAGEGQGSADGTKNEFQVTMLLTWDSVGPHTPPDRAFDIHTFVQPLPRIEPMVAVEAHAAERKNPTIKDVQWVTDRQRLEELQRAAGVNEIVMFDREGLVTEGLQTNFFAVAADGALLTAPDERVLAGTVRKVVLQVARDAGIPVRFEAPSIHDLQSWESCLVCSTSRLVKPIRELVAPELSSQKSFPGKDSVAHQVEALVDKAVRGNSEPLFE